MEMLDANAFMLNQQTILEIKGWMQPVSLVFLPLDQYLSIECYIPGRFRTSRPVIERLHVISSARLCLRYQRIDSMFCSGQHILRIAYRMFTIDQLFDAMDSRK